MVRFGGGKGAIGAKIVDMNCGGVGSEEEGLGCEGTNDGGWVDG